MYLKKSVWRDQNCNQMQKILISSLIVILMASAISMALPSAFAAEPYVSEIPDWIKNTAGWWADGQIDDRAFVSGLQWLISNGIMKIS